MYLNRSSLLLLISTSVLCFVPLIARSGANPRFSTQAADFRKTSLVLSGKRNAQTSAPRLMTQATSGTGKQRLIDQSKLLNQQVIQLYKKGRFSEAIPIAKRALSMNEKALGAAHSSVAVSFNNLAALYDSYGLLCMGPFDAPNSVPSDQLALTTILQTAWQSCNILRGLWQS